MARKNKEQDGKTTAAASRPTVAALPRARASVRRWKGIGGLGGLLLTGYLALRAGLPAFDAGLRALAGGLVGYFLVWFIALTVWKHLVSAELHALAEKRREAQLAARREAEERARAEAAAP